MSYKKKNLKAKKLLKRLDRAIRLKRKDKEKLVYMQILDDY